VNYPHTRIKAVLLRALRSLRPSAFSSCLAMTLALVLPSSLALAQVAVRADTIYTMTGENGGILKNGVILSDGKKITAIGPAAQTPIPNNYKVLTARVAVPGLIDARATVGVSGLYNQAQDQDQLEHSTPLQPELRAIDAYNPNDKLVEWVRQLGVTTVHTGHAPGELISGQTCIVKTAGKTVEEAMVVDTAMVAATLGPWAEKQGGKAPGTRAKEMALLREELIKAQEYQKKMEKAAKGAPGAKEGEQPTKKEAPPATPEAAKPVAPPDKSDAKPPAADPGVQPKPTTPPASAQPAPASSSDDDKKKDPERSLRSEMLVRVLKGEIPLLVTANRAQDIASALRLKKEFNIKLILDSAAESYLLIDEIKAAGVPVILHPTMFRMFGEMENESMETAAKLKHAPGGGIPVAIQSGYESYVPKTRVVLFEAAIAAANGLTVDEALATITIDAAKILGIDTRVGSLAPGKDADIALYDGDPFEYTTHCVGVVIDGKVVSEVVK
jgi:imidazolonepropionase-like amidohydrolase